MKFVSERLGHSTMKQTSDTYTHVMQESEAEVADIMGKILDGGIREASNDK